MDHTHAIDNLERGKMHTGKCPKCEKAITHAALEAIDIKENFTTRSWLGVSMQCPYCRTVLSVGIDPIAVKTDLVNEIKRALGARG